MASTRLAVLLAASVALCALVAPGCSNTDTDAPGQADAGPPTPDICVCDAAGPLPDAAPDAHDAGPDGCVPPAPYEPHTVLDVPAGPDIEGVVDIADPHVIRVGDTWYLYATNSKRTLPVWASTDLRRWEERGVAWQPTEGTWNARGEAWAPHVQVGDDGFYLYYTADKQIGVACSATPEGPFEELYDHPLVGGGFGGVGDGVFEYRDTAAPDWDFEEFSIDAFVLAAADGSLTMYATSYTPLSTLVAMPMADLRTVVPEDKVVVLEPDVQSWELHVVEAPWATEVDGRVVLTYSGNGADRPDYALGAAVADGPLGPFERVEGNPFLVADADKAFYGPGHHSLAPGYCGDTLLFYHTKVSASLGFERRLRYAPLTFEGARPVVPALP